MRFAATPLTSWAQTVLIGTPVRAARTMTASAQVSAKKIALVPSATANPNRGLAADTGRRRSNAIPATTTAAAAAAWLYKVPYHGTCPLNSRSSVVPMRVTTAPATGPPKNMAARIGADPTDTTLPLGSLTGIALATSVATVQKTSPGTPPISSRIGNRKIAAAITTIAAATVARMRRITLAFTGASSGSCTPAGVYHDLLPAPDPSATRECERDERPENRHQRTNARHSRSHADLLKLGLPALDKLSVHQKVPSSEQLNQDNRHTPVTERSVALLAPRSPKCPSSAIGSRRPTVFLDGTKVLSSWGYCSGHGGSSQALVWL